MAASIRSYRRRSGLRSGRIPRTILAILAVSKRAAFNTGVTEQ